MNEKVAIYKVDNDKYQYLLLPTDKVTGVEDDKLKKITYQIIFMTHGLQKYF